MSALLRHGRVALAWLRLRDGDGTPLLLLHALGGSSGDWDGVPDWPGPVHALDFCGHGASDWLRGGAYTPELLVGDADVALAALGSAVLAGAGLGAYVALLLAGARPEQVPAAVLLPGPGLDGSGAEPDFETFAYDLDAEWARPTAAQRAEGERSSPARPTAAQRAEGERSSPARPTAAQRAEGERSSRPGDPRLLACARTVRPPDYAAEFAATACRLLLVEDGSARPPWWHAARERGRAEAVPDLASALRRVGAPARALSPAPASTH